MDSITQAALGASIGEAMFGKRIGAAGAIIGAIVATIPDLDVIMLLFLDKFESITIHRGYSHSILFNVFLALLIAYALSRIKWTKTIPYSKLLIFSILALITHILLDTFTTYGTQLYLPFTDYRAGFDSISIVDPVYSFPLLLGVLFSAWWKRKSKNRELFNRIGLVLSTAYMLSTLAIKSGVEDRVSAQLNDSGIEYSDLLTVPVSAGSTTWYGVARNDSSLYLGRFSWFDDQKIEFHEFPVNDQLLDPLDSTLVDRMKWFSKDFYTVAQHEGKIRMYNLQCDMQGVRYFGEYKAPTAWYFEITPLENGEFELDTGMHQKSEE